MNTLRNRYNHTERTLASKHARRRHLQEKLQRIDEMVIAESNGQLLLEKLAEDDLKQATAVLKKLGDLAKIADEGKATTLSSVIKQAANDVNEYTGGGMMAFIKKGISAITQKMGLPVGENPIVKSVTLLNSLETGLSQLGDLISNNAPDFDLKNEKEKSVQQATAGAGDRKSWDNLLKAAKKAFRPEGFFATLKSAFKGGGIPYMEDVDATVTDILDMPAPVLLKMMQTAAGGTSTEKIAANVKDMVDASGKAKSGKPEQSNEPVTDTDQLAQALATHSKDPEAAAETAEKQPKKLIQGFVDDIAEKSKIDKGKVQKILGVLLKNKKLKGGVAEGRRVSLTMDDVVDAQMALLESRGSVGRWIQLLSEDAKKINSDIANNLDNIADFDALVTKIKNNASFGDLDEKEMTKLLNKLGGNTRIRDKVDIKNVKTFKEKLAAALKEKSKDGDSTLNRTAKTAADVADQSEELKKKIEQLTKDKDASKDTILSTYRMVMNALKASNKVFLNILTSLGSDKTTWEQFNRNITGLSTGEISIKSLQKAVALQSNISTEIERAFTKDNAKKLADAAEKDKLNDQIKKMQAAQQKALEQAGSEKGELEGKLKGKEDEIAKLTNGLKENEKVLDALAKKLNIDSGKLKNAAEGNPAELEAFVKSLFEKKPEVAAAAAKAVEGAPSNSDGKHAKLLKSIENDIKDLDTGDVSAVLDAIPSWMLAESRRRNTLAERVKFRRRDVV